MAYVVRFTPRALNDVEDYRQYILDHSNDSIAANAWVSSLFDAASTLRNFPARCPRIPEQSRFEIDLHHLLYASHRVIFHIDGKYVEILRIYHAASRPLRTLRQQPTSR